MSETPEAKAWRLRVNDRIVHFAGHALQGMIAGTAYDHRTHDEIMDRAWELGRGMAERAHAWLEQPPEPPSDNEDSATEAA